MADQHQIVHRKIHAEQQHEHRGHVLQIRAVSGNAVGFYAEAAGAGRTKGGAQRIKQGHSAQKQEHQIQHGEGKIKDVQNFRRLMQAGGQLAHAGAGAFRPQKVHGVSPAGLRGRERQQEHQNAHAAQPVAEAAPQQQAAAHGLHIRQDGRAGGGKAGHHLKHGVHIGGDLPAEHKGQAAQHGKGDPGQRGGHKALLRIKGRRGLFALPVQRDAHRQNDGDGRQIGQRHPGLAVQQAQQHARNHADGFQQQGVADHAENCFIIHGRSPPGQRAKMSFIWRTGG